jgi:DNA-binding YbaB/EbfC family protein
MANMMKMLKQAQAMQAKMQQLQEELGEREVEFSSGGGMVIARATCDGQLKALRIDPKAVDPEDVDMLEDLVLTAVRGALELGKTTQAEEMGQLTKGLQIPGMNF